MQIALRKSDEEQKDLAHERKRLAMDKDTLTKKLESTREERDKLCVDERGKPHMITHPLSLSLFLTPSLSLSLSFSLPHFISHSLSLLLSQRGAAREHTRITARKQAAN